MVKQWDFDNDYQEKDDNGKWRKKGPYQTRKKELYYRSEIFQVFHGILNSKTSIPIFSSWLLPRNYKKARKRIEFSTTATVPHVSLFICIRSDHHCSKFPCMQILKMMLLGSYHHHHVKKDDNKNNNSRLGLHSQQIVAKFTFMGKRIEKWKTVLVAFVVWMFCGAYVNYT